MSSPGGAQEPGSAQRRRPAEIAGLVFSSLLMSPYPPVAGELALFDTFNQRAR